MKVNLDFDARHAIWGLVHNMDLISVETYVQTRDGNADADRMPIQNMRRIYRAISDICRIMRISASANISPWPSLVQTIAVFMGSRKGFQFFSHSALMLEGEVDFLKVMISSFLVARIVLDGMQHN